MKNMQRILIILFLLVSFFSSQAQITPKYSNEFLAIGVEAKGLSLGSSMSATANDVSASYWNPAGLLNIKTKYQAAATHNQYFGGIASYNYAGFAAKIDTANSLAFTVIRMGVDGIPNTLNLRNPDGSFNFDNVSSFSEASYAFMFSYAGYNKWIPRLRTGLNFKVLHRNAGQFANAWGFGIDLGGQYDFKKWTLGFMARDITTTFNTWNYNIEAIRETFGQTGQKIPNNSTEITLPRLLIDLSRPFDLSQDFKIRPSIGVECTFDGKRNTIIQTNFLSADLRAGVDVGYKEIIFLRAGYGNFQQVKDINRATSTTGQLSTGIGLQISWLMIDYALTNFGTTNAGLASHVISLKANFK
jgi:hypothetical protein